MKVRHRTRWYAMARRLGHEERHHWRASSADALVIAEWQREAFKRMADLERFETIYNRLTETPRALFYEYLETLRRQK